MDVQNRYKFSQHNLFRGINLTLANPIVTEEFVTKVRRTWEVLRFQQPVIALGLELDQQQNVHMTYRAVENHQALKDWSERTVRFCPGETDLDELRFHKGQSTVPEETGDQTFLYVVARSPTSYGLLFHSHHISVDGIGMKIMFTKFCTIFASGLDPDSLDWGLGKEASNLAPGFLSILGEKEVLSGPLYEQNVYTVLDDYFQAMDVRFLIFFERYGVLCLSQRRVGIKPRDFRPGPTRRHHVTLSVEESQKLLKGVKSIGYTLNVVGKYSNLLLKFCS